MKGIKPDQIRMWLSGDPEKLESSLKAIAESKQGMEVDEESKDGKSIFAFDISLK